MHKSYTIFSDGGSDGRGGSGSATILDFGTHNRLQVVCDLGQATNNEAEIFSGVLGFYLLSSMPDTKDFYTNASLHWVSDSQYALKSASQYISNWVRNGWKTASKEPVKNQGLWKLFLGVTNSIQFSTEHVRGHTGHYENELCDMAVGWVREQGASVVKDGWVVIDCIDLINELRLLDSIPDRKQIDQMMSGVLEKVLRSGTKGSLKKVSAASDSPKEEHGIDNLVIEATNKYFLDLKKIQGIKEYLNENPDLKKSLTGLKSWLKRLS